MRVPGPSSYLLWPRADVHQGFKTEQDHDDQSRELGTGAGMTHKKLQRCGGQLNRKMRPTAHLRGEKISVHLSKMIPEEHDRLCPWMTRQDTNSCPRAPSRVSRKPTSAQRAASQRKHKWSINWHFFFSFFFPPPILLKHQRD